MNSDPDHALRAPRDADDLHDLRLAQGRPNPLTLLLSLSAFLFHVREEFS